MAGDTRKDEVRGLFCSVTATAEQKGKIPPLSPAEPARSPRAQQNKELAPSTSTAQGAATGSISSLLLFELSYSGNLNATKTCWGCASY